KSSWPELVGVCGEIAAKTIEKENSLVTVLLVPPGIPDRALRCERVIVYVDEKGIVTSVPGLG
ncbi:UNVERIFIED_CONTAM: Glu S.griseus protease inhibitor, partial [Sesamum indicum]